MGITDWFGRKEPEKPQVSFYDMQNVRFKAVQARLKKAKPVKEYSAIAISADDDFRWFYAAYAAPGWDYQFIYDSRGEVSLFRERGFAEDAARQRLINDLNAVLRDESER